MTDNHIHKVILVLRSIISEFKVPIVTEYANANKNPFHILISTLLSLRTKDSTTAKASKSLFSVANTPKLMSQLSESKIEKLIYPVGFYKVKAKNIKEICTTLTNKYNSIVPDDIDELLTLKGIGRKTANLVVTLGYNKPGICVDIHVHRISNRLGYVKTKTPYHTEMILRKKLPFEYWIEFNDLLVSYGQNICRPTSPICSKCYISTYCDRVGVSKSR